MRMPTLHQSSASIPQQVALACPGRCRSSWSQQSEQSLVMHPSTYCVAQTNSQTAREQIKPQTTLWQTAPPCQAHQQQQLGQLPGGQAGSTNQPQSTEKCPLQHRGGSMSHPRLSTAYVSQCQRLRERQKRAALFAVLQAWHVIALQETHHATQAEAVHWCREGAGPTAPREGPSFWAAGISVSRSVALLFKACPLLSGVSADSSSQKSVCKTSANLAEQSVASDGLANAFLSDQPMASSPRKGQAKRFGAKTTSHDGKAGHVMTHVCHRARQEQRQVRPCKRRCRKHAPLHLAQRLERLNCQESSSKHVVLEHGGL